MLSLYKSFLFLLLSCNNNEESQRVAESNNVEEYKIVRSDDFKYPYARHDIDWKWTNASILLGN